MYVPPLMEDLGMAEVEHNPDAGYFLPSGISPASPHPKVAQLA